MGIGRQSVIGKEEERCLIPPRGFGNGAGVAGLCGGGLGKRESDRSGGDEVLTASLLSPCRTDFADGRGLREEGPEDAPVLRPGRHGGHLPVLQHLPHHAALERQAEGPWGYWSVPRGPLALPGRVRPSLKRPCPFHRRPQRPDVCPLSSILPASPDLLHNTALQRKCQSFVCTSLASPLPVQDLLKLYTAFRPGVTVADLMVTHKSKTDKVDPRR